MSTTVWNSLECPFKNTSKPLAINPHEYVILGRNEWDDPVELQKYNTDTNEWSLMLKLDMNLSEKVNFNIYAVPWVIDTESKIIYVLLQNSFIIDLKDNTVKVLEDTITAELQCSILALVDNKIHLIDSDKSINF